MMQTVYFTTSNFIRHEGNLVDLTEYRRKLAQAQGQGSAAPEKEEPAPAPRAHTGRRRRKGLMSALTLDNAASLALIVTALSFAVKIL